VCFLSILSLRTRYGGGLFLNIRDKYEIQDNESQHFFSLF